MPTYQYVCTECSQQIDVVQSFTDDALTECPACSGRLRKLFSAVGVVFKGSGFYRTDSRAGEKKGAASKGSGGDKGSAERSTGGDKSAQGSGDKGSGDKGSGDKGSSGSSAGASGGAASSAGKKAGSASSGASSAA